MQAALTNLIGLDLKLKVMLCNPRVSQGSGIAVGYSAGSEVKPTSLRGLELSEASIQLGVSCCAGLFKIGSSGSRSRINNRGAIGMERRRQAHQAFRW
jgi:hypothetical protein